MLLLQSEGEDLLVLQKCDIFSHPRRADISFTPLRKYKNSLKGKYARNSRKNLKEYRAPETNRQKAYKKWCWWWWQWWTNI